MIGGDTNEAADIVISGIALGVARGDTLMKREGARPGDILATTGLFGETAAAFKVLLEGYEASEELKATLVESVLNPMTRVEEGVALAETGSVSASIDSSDGLAISLHDLTRSSNVGFRLDSIPTSPNAIKFAGLHGLRPEDLALYGGEEYELVFTLRPSELENAEEALQAVGGELIVLGEATAEGDIVFMEDGARKPVGKKGWEHFTGA